MPPTPNPVILSCPLRTTSLRKPCARPPAPPPPSKLHVPAHISMQVVPSVAKFGGAVAVSGLRTTVLRELGSQLVVRHAQYEAALGVALASGGKGVASGAAMAAAKQGLTGAVARYTAARSLLSLVGPLMWASAIADLAWMSIGTDYARIVKVVFVLAQIRLLRTSGWSQDAAATRVER
jgi:uncharacterized protein YaaW (UPF0174 family)